jgi:hypothetical protein
MDVHVGEAGHVTTTIGVLYYLFKAVVEYCVEVDYYHNDPHEGEQEDPPFLTDSIRHGRDFVKVQIPTKDWVETHHPSIIRPNLTERHWDHLLPPLLSSEMIFPHPVSLPFWPLPWEPTTVKRAWPPFSNPLHW